MCISSIEQFDYVLEVIKINVGAFDMLWTQVLKFVEEFFDLTRTPINVYGIIVPVRTVFRLDECFFYS